MNQIVEHLGILAALPTSFMWVLAAAAVGALAALGLHRWVGEASDPGDQSR